MNLPAFSKTYDGVKVLDFPGLALKPGKIYAILGANGSGKSTFARIAAGILPADQKCRIPGSVGYLPQKPYAFRMSVIGRGNPLERAALFLFSNGNTNGLTGSDSAQ